MHYERLASDVHEHLKLSGSENNTPSVRQFKNTGTSMLAEGKVIFKGRRFSTVSFDEKECETIIKSGINGVLRSLVSILEDKYQVNPTLLASLRQMKDHRNTVAHHGLDANKTILPQADLVLAGKAVIAANSMLKGAIEEVVAANDDAMKTADGSLDFLFLFSASPRFSLCVLLYSLVLFGFACFGFCFMYSRNASALYVICRLTLAYFPAYGSTLCFFCMFFLFVFKRSFCFDWWMHGAFNCTV